MLFLDDERYFWGLCAILPIILLYLLYYNWRKRNMAAYASNRMWRQLGMRTSYVKVWFRLALILIIIIAGVFALVNPKIGTKLKKVQRRGADIVFVIDVSKSMLAEDVAPNRLSTAKNTISKMLNHLASDRVGLVVYAGNAYPQLPLTTDYSAVRLFLKNINTDIVPSHGTDISAAISMALDYFKSEHKSSKHRAIVLISDGEDHEGNAEAIADLMKEQDVHFLALSVGTTSGAPIPIKQGDKVISYKNDQDGKMVITKANVDFLGTLANHVDGRLINGNSPQVAVDQMHDILKNMDRVEAEDETFSEYADQFQWLIGLVLLLVLIDLLISDGKTLWIQKWMT